MVVWNYVGSWIGGTYLTWFLVNFPFGILGSVEGLQTLGVQVRTMPEGLVPKGDFELWVG